MGDHPRIKDNGAVRAAGLTTPHRHAELKASYNTKYLRHDDIQEGDEDETAYRQQYLPPNEALLILTPLSKGTRRETMDKPLEMNDLATTVVASPVPRKTEDIAELCQYIQKLETEKRDLLDQVQFLRDHDATHKVNLAAASRRIDKLESLLQHASHASDSQQQVQWQIEAAIAAEKEVTAAMAIRVENVQRRYEDAERARQHAVFKLSELQTTMAEAATIRLLTPPHAQHQRPSLHNGRLTATTASVSDERLDPTSGSSERLEKYKREIELLRQKLELREHQAHEKQKLAVELALRSAQLEHAAALHKLKLECEIQLSDWRHDEAVRAKEIEAAMEQDRYSIRLEMTHGMQRAQIEQRVYYLQAQAALTTSSAAASASASNSASKLADGDVPFSAMDEVLVRLQLELLRTRRFAALKTLLLIRQAVVDRAMRKALVKWKTLATQTTLRRRHAVQHMHRIVSGFEKQDTRASFQRWRLHAQQLTAETERQRVAACWNRMVAVERMVHVLQQRTVKQLAGSFHWWRLHTASSGSTFTTANGSVETAVSRRPDGDTSPTVTPTADETVAAAAAETAAVGGGVELQDEIRKLHEQLASSKSEAWRYKRQLLKQFL